MEFAHARGHRRGNQPVQHNGHRFVSVLYAIAVTNSLLRPSLVCLSRFDLSFLSFSRSFVRLFVLSLVYPSVRLSFWISGWLTGKMKLLLQPISDLLSGSGAAAHA